MERDLGVENTRSLHNEEGNSLVQNEVEKTWLL
jgi:hypothetical protein